MSKASSFPWKLLLSHSRPENLGRCLELSLGQRQLRLCTRCVGLYPSLTAFLAIRLSGFDAPSGLDLLLRLVVPIVGAIAWALEQSGLDLSKPLRLLSGLLIGAGLGWVLGIHFISPWPRELVELMSALALILMLGALSKFIRNSRDQTPLLLPIDLDTMGEDKKTDLPGQNEVDPKAS